MTKWICKICGYIYDEQKQAVPFRELPDTWVCPLCGADKGSFAPEEEAKPQSQADDPSFFSLGQASAPVAHGQMFSSRYVSGVLSLRGL